MMKSSMKVNGVKASMYEKARDYRYGKMGLFMKDGGSTIKRMVEADLYMLNVTFTKENGLMIKLMGTVNTYTWMVLLIKAIG